LSLPRRAEPFDHRASEPFFGGLLPEEGVRERIARYLRVTARNDFALLAEIGGECAGAVSLHAETPDTAAPADPDRGPRELSDDELATLLDELPRRPLLVGGEARLSLAGAQDKVAVAVAGDAIALPTGDAPTTHILKTPIAGLVGTVWNELVCLRTAAALGLPVARAERREHRGVEFLLVERYDRTTWEGTAARLHQEDFCQALGVPTRTKYQSEGGPGLDALFALLSEHATRPALDRIALLRATLFNVLVGNADAHGKNFGLLHGNEPVGRAGVQLAPLYDLLSTLVYPDLSRRYAMKIGRAREFADVKPDDWTLFAERAGLSPAQVRRELGALAQKLPRALAETIDGSASDASDDARAMLGTALEDTTVRCEIAARHARVRAGA
ncbi:MAG: type II toxin-antitoxin system HipA family toxin, partial [Planctomycetota bacterium]